MAQLKIRKVDALPSTLQASTLYLVRASETTFSIYLTDKDGVVNYRSPDSSDISTIVLALINALKGQPGGLASLDLSGNVEQPVLTALGIDGQDGILTSNGNAVWGSIDEFLIATGTGTNDPTRITLFNNIQGLRFRSDRLVQVWADFQIPYDYALGTVVYPVIHWMPTTTLAGVCRWGLEYSVAKGNGQAVFPATTTVYINANITTGSQWKNLASEFASVVATNLEPDSTIKMRIFRDGGNAADTYAGDTNAWKVSLRYQKARIGTRNRTPNFYT